MLIKFTGNSRLQTPRGDRQLPRMAGLRRRLFHRRRRFHQAHVQRWHVAAAQIGYQAEAERQTERFATRYRERGAK